MPDNEEVSVQHLLTGRALLANIKSTDGRTLELEVREENDLSAETPVEISTERSIYLGIVERKRQRRLWVTVEHVVDRTKMEQIRSAWKAKHG